MSTPFWLSNPEILLDKNNITQLWINNSMSFEEKLNAISRLIILLTIIGYLVTRNTKIIITGLVTLLALIILHRVQTANNTNKIVLKEGFCNANPKLYELIKNNYTQPSNKNPAMNVLLTEIADDPNRKQAAPAYNPAVEKQINESTQNFVMTNFDNDPIIKDRLFKDLGDSFEFDQSMRSWYATPNTRVENDQTAFAKFCFGDMISCKEGDAFGCTRNMPPRWTNY